LSTASKRRQASYQRAQECRQPSQQRCAADGIDEVIAAFRSYFTGRVVRREPEEFGNDELSAEIRHMQKAAGVLACI
jgi:hypothetical protein